MPEKIIFFLLILSASCLNNLLIPFFIYYKKYGFFRKRNKNFIGCNSWGIIMDGILAGLINIVMLNLLLNIKLRVKIEDMIIAFILGFVSMLLAHIYMVVAKWKIWIMPKPWQFNLAGYWHIISMTLQMSFLFYPLILIMKNPFLWGEDIVQTSLTLIFFFALLFLLCLKLMKKGVKIGNLNISNKPW